jgi:hypothetical protein
MNRSVLTKVVPAARTPLPPPPPLPLAQRLDKLEGDLATLRANARVDEVYVALGKRDHARAGELLRDPETHAAYRTRLAGERYAAPVKVTKVETDHRAEVRKLLAAGDADGLTRLFRSAPAAHGQYREMLGTEGLRAAAAEGVAKRARTPADVPAAEVARWRERIRGLLKAKDQKGLDAARREGGAAFQAAWLSMTVAGERMTM